MPEDGLNTGQNMDSTDVKLTISVKINLCYVRKGLGES
jgi:hypothetical protein